MIGHLDEDNLRQVYASTSTEVGGTTSFKLKKASPFFFGASMVEVHQVAEMSTNILEGAFMFFSMAFYSTIEKDEKFSM